MVAKEMMAPEGGNERADATGRSVAGPARRGRRPHWRTVIRRTVESAISDRVSLIAAGCAFWATLALFPAITTLIFIYGLVFDPRAVEPQLQLLARFLPPAAFELIAGRVHTLVHQHHARLSIGLAISTGIALWSSATGTKSLLQALNLAYNTAEQRGFLRFQAVSLMMTLCAILGGVLAISVLVFIPAVLQFLGLSGQTRMLARTTGFLVLVVFLLVSLSLLYCFGPSRRARWRMVTPGSLFATLLWLVASVAFSAYVADLANYTQTYGPLAAVAAVMMWFWVTVYSVLMGAELNAEIERDREVGKNEGQ
jgi:membrane protein